ncbi:MAG: ComEA family DNA-binding protein [Myxococcota bacterium]|nr:ComEA family DNA-binding protein [Myxococcota bacterium]
MTERLDFGSRTPHPVTGRVVVMAVGLAMVGGLLIIRESFFWRAGGEAAVVVQVQGDVPRPGWYPVEPPTLHEAVRAAGGNPESLEDRSLETAQSVWVEGVEARVGPSGNERVFGLPMDLNAADAKALQVLPGIGEVRAQAIVDWREAQGPFGTVEGLDDIPGIGKATLERIRPFVHVQR